MGFFSKLFGGGQKEEQKPKKENSRAEASSASTPEEDWEGGSGVPQELAHMEVLELYNSENPPVFLDVREPHELEADGFIPNSIHIPLGELEQRASELEPEKPVIVYCASGMRSMDAGCALLEKGFKDVSNLNGGIMAWTGPRETKTS